MRQSALGAMKVALGAVKLASSRHRQSNGQLLDKNTSLEAVVRQWLEQRYWVRQVPVAKGGLFAGLGLGAFLGIGGAGARLGIIPIEKGLQTFNNNVDGRNLSDVAEAIAKMLMATCD